MADAGTGEKLKVFISYSRRDSAAFVDDLVVGLEDRGFAPILDRHDIKPGEPWEARLGGLIEQSDTVVFVVSPEEVKSERCGWEIDKTLALSKRTLGLVLIVTGGTLGYRWTHPHLGEEVSEPSQQDRVPLLTTSLARSRLCLPPRSMWCRSHHNAARLMCSRFFAGCNKSSQRCLVRQLSAALILARRVTAHE
jgi:hypothetical protein